MKNSRSKNVALNITIGYVAQIGILLLSFVGRRIFVHFLSIEYLGINGLYSNILSILSLAELGLGSVTQFYLYKPVAERNYALVTTLIRYFRKVYYIIAFAVLSLGLLLIPFLKYIINSDLPQNELIIYYILLLLNSVVTYLVAPEISLLSAYQDNRLQKMIMLATSFIIQIAHIVVLIIWQNYIVYVVVTLIGTIGNAIILGLICNKRYPYLKQRFDKVDLDKKSIITSVKSTFIYKIGATIVNSTDNILISIMVSTAAVGLYSNYNMVVVAIQGLITIITSALISGIGNLSAEGNKNRMLSIFNVMLLAYHFIAAIGGISFYFLFNELIPIWLGDDFLLNNATVFAIAINFYQTNAISPVWMYREVNGLFVKVKYLSLATALCNIVLSIIFGYLWGMFGILLATFIARAITQVWYEPRILYSTVFGQSEKLYWLRQGKYFLLTVISTTLCYFISLWLPHGFLFIIIKALLFFIICSSAFILGNIRTPELEEVKNIVFNLYKSTKQKLS